MSGWLFCIQYEKSEFCTWNCEYTYKACKKLFSPPFLDLLESCYYEKDIINNLPDVYNKYIFIYLKIKFVKKMYAGKI